MQKLSACLSDASEGDDDPVNKDVSSRAPEATSLMVRMILGNSRVVSSFNDAADARSFLGGTRADHWRRSNVLVSCKNISLTALFVFLHVQIQAL